MSQFEFVILSFFLLVNKITRIRMQMLIVGFNTKILHIALCCHVPLHILFWHKLDAMKNYHKFNKKAMFHPQQRLGIKNIKKQFFENEKIVLCVMIKRHTKLV